MSSLLVLEEVSTLPDVYAEVSTDIVLCEQVSQGRRFDVRSQTLCGVATHPSHRELEENNLNLHLDDQWHTVFVDCMRAQCAPHPSVEPTVRSQHHQLRAQVLDW